MKRNIITGFNQNWIVGHSEVLVKEQWEHALHSDWVFAIFPHHHAALGGDHVIDDSPHSVGDVIKDKLIVCTPEATVGSYVNQVLTIMRDES